MRIGARVRSLCSYCHLLWGFGTALVNDLQEGIFEAAVGQLQPAQLRIAQEKLAQYRLDLRCPDFDARILLPHRAHARALPHLVPTPPRCPPAFSPPPP